MLTKHNEIKAWLDSMNIENYTINIDNTVTVDGNVDIGNRHLTSIPVQFRFVHGYFNCWSNILESLEGSPQEVDSHFNCWNNDLDSLEGAPREVGGDFDCSDNRLDSLEGAPLEVGGDFDCSDNGFTTMPTHDTIINDELFWE